MPSVPPLVVRRPYLLSLSLVAASSLRRRDLQTAAASSSSFTGCSVSDYYPPSLYLYDQAQLHDLLQSTHRNVVPYTSAASDCWDALIALDSDVTDPATGTANLVHLIYADLDTDATPHGTPDTWNREHVWPKSHGVGYEGPDFTDLHALRPSDWNVNAARSNRHFAPCGIAEVSASECVRPAHGEAAVDTERDSFTFLPPANVRGDVARAAFYMSVRYDGSEADTLNLTLTDCPDDKSIDEGRLGYLSHLLRWHLDDPVDDRERIRNDAICEDWQGNRNPFVDFPDLVAYHFGVPRDYPAVDGGGYDCSVPNPPGPSPPPPPPPSPVPAPAPATPSVGGGGLCKGLRAGDVMPVGLRSDSPDTVVLVALADVAGGAEVYITDNAWTGTEFKSNEGVRKLVVPTEGIASGTIFGYGDSSLALSSSWTIESGSFSLSSTADAVHVYCTDETAEDQPYHHISAFSYSSTGWAEPNSDPAAFSSGESSLPSTLPRNAVITLDHRDNYRYGGVRTGTRTELLNYISSSIEWIGDDSDRFDVVTGWTSFSVALDTCTSGLTAGDVMIGGYNSDDPDSVALVALVDIPVGAEIYITDAAWTGTEFASQEGHRRYVAPEGGIAAGTVFGYGDGFEDVWENESGSFALSTSLGDTIFVYCTGGTGGDATVHLSGLTYSTSGWVSPSADDGAFSTSESSLPAGLCSDCSIALEHVDNAVYVGNRGGTKGEILSDMSDAERWSGNDNERFDLKFILGQFAISP